MIALAPRDETAGDRGPPAGSIEFMALGRQVGITCQSGLALQPLQANFAGFAPSVGGSPDLSFRVEALASPAGALALFTGARRRVIRNGLAELLFHIEQDLVVWLQAQRPDLLFLHAAALERGGRIVMLAGDSGQGKSTTAWGLLHHGFRYLSDELCPLEPAALRVHAYPHALCLKRPPPPSFPLPPETLDAGSRLYVPTAALPGGCAPDGLRLAAVLFVRHVPGRQAPGLERLGRGEAALRLYTVTLNALAHGNAGLDAVADIAGRVPCYALETGDLDAACRLVDERVSGQAPSLADAS